MSKPKAKPWATAKIMEALRRRYPAEAYAFFTEVRNQTGFVKQERTADAMVMSLWPSRGLALHGFEVKASRTDWLKEMRTPDKAEAIQSYCDRWWLVVGSASIVKPSELPETWGLLVPSGTGLKVKVDAPKLEPKPLDRTLVASILRCAARASDQDLERARMAGIKDGRENEANYRRSTLDSLKEAVAAFEKASGVEISTWDGQHIGDAVKFVLEGKHLQVVRGMQALRRQAQKVIDIVDDAAKDKT